MPKLNDDVAEKVNEAEDGFAPVEEGVYTLELMEDVEVKEGRVAPYWRWTFEIPEGEQYAGRRFWTNTSLSDNAFWKLKEAFDAFGVPTNTDTEDLVKRRVKALITIRTIEKGQRQGQLTNEIDKLMPLDTATDDTPSANGNGGKSAKAKKDDDGPLF